MILAAILLGLGSLGGGFLLAIRLRGANPPLGLALGHGLLVGSGLAALAISVLTARATGAPLVALAGFVAAAGIGFWMLREHRAGRLIPIAGVFLHLMTVVLGWAALLAHFFG